ncbi:hypothetical protein ACQW02_27570 [Humitalea sp. 24SJ18S-53]|uniref:hypothetical protein n=1 Tax=Humitalea sp. 24SJ18S-53 TaxID=3422307 RepID=UPI003D67E745
MTVQRISTEPAGPRQPGAPRAPVKAADFKAALARLARPAVAQAAAPAAAAPAQAVVQQVALGRGAVPPSQPASGQAFRDRIAQAERSAEHPGGGYTQRNPTSGAIGRYQMIPAALQDIGWRDADGGWTARAAAQGVRSEADFLASPDAQEAAMGDYLRRTAAQLTAHGAQAGRSVTGSDGQPVPVTEAGLLAAAHRRGAGAVARWLAHRETNPDTPPPPAQRAAFASIEARLRGFADLPAPTARPITLASAGRGQAS